MIRERTDGWKAPVCMTLIMTLVFSCGIASAGAGQDLVQVQMLADVSAVAPGSTFTVGVLMTIKPKWHVYWRNPGEAGLPTEVALKLPKGFKAERLQWPVPVTFVQGGGIVGYGYERSVMLLTNVTAPKNLVVGSKVKLGADVSWLSCTSEVCVPGKATVKLDLSAAKPSKSANVEVFETWRNRLPVDIKAKNCPAKAEVSIKSGAKATVEIGLHWKLPPKRVLFYPPAATGIETSLVSIATKKKHCDVVFTVRFLPGHKIKATTVDVLIVSVDANNTRRGVIVPIRVDHLQKRVKG